MVALTLCEAARSPFDIICGARAAVWVCGGGWVCAAIMHARRVGARGLHAAYCCAAPCRLYINTADRRYCIRGCRRLLAPTLLEALYEVPTGSHNDTTSTLTTCKRFNLITLPISTRDCVLNTRRWPLSKYLDVHLNTLLVFRDNFRTLQKTSAL